MNRALPMLLTLSLVVFGSVAASAGDHSVHPAVQNLSDMKVGPIPGLPTCAPGAVMNGDPGKGSSILIAKIDAGCVVPWHWHTPDEHLMMISGSAQLETKDGAPMTLNAGGYAKVPGRHAHRFTCTSACSMYVFADAAFDIHYIDAQGVEIAPAEALKVVNETAATMGK